MWHSFCCETLSKLQSLGDTIIYFKLNYARNLLHNDTSLTINLRKTFFRISAGEGRTVKVTYNVYLPNAGRKPQSDGNFTEQLTTPCPPSNSRELAHNVMELLDDIDVLNVSLTNIERNFLSHDDLYTWLTTPPEVLTSRGFADYLRELLLSIDALNVYFKLGNASCAIRTGTIDDFFTAHVRIKYGSREYFLTFTAFFLLYDANEEIESFFRNDNVTKHFRNETELREWLTTPTEEQSKMLVLCKLDLPLDIKKKLKRYVGA